MNSVTLENISSVAVIGGKQGIDYSPPLKEMGFEEVYSLPVRENCKRVERVVSKADIAILISGFCSHEYKEHAISFCKKEGVPLIIVPGRGRNKAASCLEAYLKGEDGNDHNFSVIV